jgi:hypothetical protein
VAVPVVIDSSPLRTCTITSGVALVMICSTLRMVSWDTPATLAS